MAKSSSVSQPDRSHSPSLSEKPILVCLGLFLAVIALRSIDLFALRLDDFTRPAHCFEGLGNHPGTRISLDDPRTDQLARSSC